MRTSGTEHIPAVLIESCLANWGGRRAILTHSSIHSHTFTVRQLQMHRVLNFSHLHQHTAKHTLPNPGGKVLLNRGCGMSPLTQAFTSPLVSYHMFMWAEEYMMVIIYCVYREWWINGEEYRNFQQPDDLRVSFNGFCFHFCSAQKLYVCLFFFFTQVLDNAVMALVPKQVTAYNSVNNSTVSRTSASKYGKWVRFCSSWAVSGFSVTATFLQTHLRFTHFIYMYIYTHTDIHTYIHTHVYISFLNEGQHFKNKLDLFIVIYVIFLLVMAVSHQANFKMILILSSIT